MLQQADAHEVSELIGYQRPITGVTEQVELQHIYSPSRAQLYTERPKTNHPSQEINEPKEPYRDYDAPSSGTNIILGANKSRVTGESGDYLSP